MRASVPGLLVALACSGSPTTDSPPSTVDTTDTGVLTVDPGPFLPTTSSGSIEASCSWHEGNQLRIACTASLGEPEPLTLRVDIPGEPARTYTRDAAVAHEVRIFDLPTDTTLTWEASTPSARAEGYAVTGSGPPGTHVALEPVAGEPFREESVVERLLIPWGCGIGDDYLVITDGLGRLRWYHSIERNGLDALALSDRGTILAVFGRSTLLEIGLEGDVRRLLGEREGIELPLHHDVASRHGQTLAINARLVEGTDRLHYISDGLYELGDPGEEAPPPTDVWHLASVMDPTGLSSPVGENYWGNALRGIDFGHANSIDVDARGRWLISFKYLDTVMAIDGDPASPARGQILWQLVGGELGVTGDALALTAANGQRPGFEYPHHARWVGPDRITLFDNGRAGASRVVEIAIDEEAGEAVLQRSWGVGARCPILSSGYLLEGGTMVATCTSAQQLLEFDAEGELRRRAQLACAGQATLQPPQIVKVIPLAPFGMRPEGAALR